MLLKYIGKRASIANDVCHVRYVFNKENAYVCDVPKDIARTLLITGLYEPPDENVTLVIKEEAVKEEIKRQEKKPIKKYKNKR